MKEKLFDQIKKINLGTFNRRSFWIALIGGFMMALFQNMGAHFNFFSPLPDRATQVQADVMNTVAPLLHKKKNTIKLEKKSSYAPIDVSSRAYIVVDMENATVLDAKNADISYPIASLTKVMSAVVALDLASPTEEFTVTQRAADIIPTKIGVVPGQKMKVEELLHAMLLTSANDATEVVRDGIDQKYGKGTFVKAMNEKAEFLGLTKSHFENPQGFDAPAHYASAEDLAVLSLYAMKNYSLINEIAKKDYAFLPQNRYHKQFDLYNWNGLIGVYPHVFGLKIGVTENAGNTTIVAAERDGKKLLTVLLGADTIINRDLDAASLLDAGFAQDANLSPIAIDESMLRAKYAQWEYWN